MHPAEEEAPGWTEGASKVGVLAAGFGDGGAQFGERQRAKEGENCAYDPRGEDDADGAAFAGHFGGLEEDAGADHGADDDGAGGPGA